MSGPSIANAGTASDVMCASDEKRIGQPFTAPWRLRILKTRGHAKHAWRWSTWRTMPGHFLKSTEVGDVHETMAHGRSGRFFSQPRNPGGINDEYSRHSRLFLQESRPGISRSEHRARGSRPCISRTRQRLLLSAHHAGRGGHRSPSPRHDGDRYHRKRPCRGRDARQQGP